MPITLSDVLKQLDIDEPNYTAIAALGPEVLPHLAVLIRGEDLGIASKAAYLASLIQSEDSIEVLSVAATSPHVVVRVAAAAGLRNMSSPQMVAIADHLLDDADPGVRKQALHAAGQFGMDSLEAKVKAIASKDSESAIRQLANQELKRIAEVHSTGKSGGNVGSPKSTKRSVRKRTKSSKKQRP